MKTKFKLIFKNKEVKEKGFEVDLSNFKKSLSNDFSLEKEGVDFFVLIETQKDEDDSAQYLIDRELDKYFFLTHIDIKTEMIKSHIALHFEAPLFCYGILNENIVPQNWNYELPLQLRLWKLAEESNNERLKMLNYFQIIELSYPDTNNATDYPFYQDSSTVPNPKTECKFLRHLIAHAGEVTGKQLIKYCEYLQVPAVMFDVTDNEYQNILISKVDLLKEQAMITIESQLTSINSRDKRGGIIANITMGFGGSQQL